MSRHILSFSLIFLFSYFSQAEMGVPIQLRLKSPGGVYPSESGLNFKLLVLSPSSNCILREENFSSQSINNGNISLILGAGSLGANDPALSLNQVYDNSKAKTGLFCVDANNNIISSGQSYTPLASDHRVIRVATTIGADSIIVNFNLRATPYAIQAESVGGKTAAEIVVNDAATQMNQTNLNDLLLDMTRFNNLKNIAVNGQAITTASFTGSLVGDVSGTQGATSVDKIKGIAVSPISPTNGDVLQYNGTQYVPVPVPSAPVSSVAGRTGAVVLTSADISGLGGSAGLNVGATAGTVAAGNDSRIVNALQPSSFLTGDVSGTPSATVVDAIGGKTSVQVSNAVNDIAAATSANTANTIVKRDASGDVFVNSIISTNSLSNNVYIYDAANSIRIKAPASLAANYVLTLPADDGAFGQVLQTDGNGILSWVSTSGGTVSSVTASAPLASSGGANPNITITTANATTSGALSSSDWTSFNTKQSTSLTNGRIRIGSGSNIATEQLLSGDATMNNTGVLTLASTVTAGTVGSASAIPSITYDAKGRITSTISSAYQDATGVSKGIVQAGANISVSSGVISVATASASMTGVISAADWNTFNNKQGALGFTPLNPANNLSDLAVPSTARVNLGLGSSAVLDAGVAASNLVQLDGSARIPASTLPTSALTTSTTFSGDVSGTNTTISVDRIKGTAISATAPTAGQALVYDGTSWQPTTGLPSFTRSTANQTFSTTTLTDVTSQSFAVTSGVVYKYRFHILYTSAATTTGLRLSLTYPAVTTASAIAQIPSGADGISAQFQGTINTSGDIVTATATSAATSVHYASIQGIIIPSANGTVQLRAASEINASNIIIRAGSFVEVNAVP